MIYTNKKNPKIQITEFFVQDGVKATGVASIGCSHLVIGKGIDGQNYLICPAWGDEAKDKELIQHVITNDYIAA